LATFSRSHELSQAIARKELDKAGFEISSAPAAWEHLYVNADNTVVITNVPLSPSKFYVPDIRHFEQSGFVRVNAKGGAVRWYKSRPQH
jgi:hypothetical protein